MSAENRSFGRYQLLNRLGGGGMAEVWRAEVSYSADVSKIVALKMIREDLVRMPQFKSLFIDEARITSRISHANVAQIVDFGEEQGRPYLAMELVEGPDLESILQRSRELGQHLPLSFCAHVVAEVARGLAAAHGLADAEGRPYGIVHRDVSPQNVLVSYAGEVKLTDFGIAKARDKLTQTETGTVMGKFRYMSPEQVQGQPLDARSDLFSCGVLLYELLTGLQLFDGRTSAEVVDQIRYKSLPDLVALRRDVDPALETVLRWTLSRDPTARCPDASTLARDLERYIHVAHPQFTRDDVVQLLCALIPRAAPGRAAPLAFAGTELATPSEATLPAGAPAAPGAAPPAGGPRLRTLAGTGSEPAAVAVTTPAKRTAASPGPGASPEGGAEGAGTPSAATAAPGSLPVEDPDADAVPLSPMDAKPTQAYDGTWGPVASPASGVDHARATAAPGEATPREATPREPTQTLGKRELRAAPTSATGVEERASQELADAITAALGGEDPDATAPTRPAVAPAEGAAASPKATALEETRTQDRPRRSQPASAAPPRRGRRPEAVLGVVIAVLLLGGLAALVWRSRAGDGTGTHARPGTQRPRDAGSAAHPADGEMPRPVPDGGATDPQSRIALLDAQLAQLHILRGPRDGRVLRALAAIAGYRLRLATVDEQGVRHLGPPAPEALRLPAGDPLRDTVSAAADVLAARLLLGGPLPAQAQTLLQPLAAPLPDRASLPGRFAGTALYVLAAPESALAQELHLRAMGWAKAWRKPLAGAGGKRFLWPHLAVARDAVARLLALDSKHPLGWALKRYLEAQPRSRAARQGALAARITDVKLERIKKSPTSALRVTLSLRNTDDQKPIPLQPLRWWIHGVDPAPKERSYTIPDTLEPLAPGKELTITVNFVVPSGAASPAMVLSVERAGTGPLWMQVSSELLP